jgi:NhaP-type Na+/H+ or K+/H+ antiporter
MQNIKKFWLERQILTWKGIRGSVAVEGMLVVKNKCTFSCSNSVNKNKQISKIIPGIGAVPIG